MSNYLQLIVERKKQEVASLSKPIRFIDALKADGLSVIAEIKRKSPSKGFLNEALDPAKLAKQYVAGGAAAISVLTDEAGFGGTLKDLRAVIEACPGVPVLRKDFIIDVRQLYETARAGAHAVLLIAAALKERLPEFIREAKKYGLETLVEVHNAEELALAESAGAEIIGVNNRSLETFAVSLDTAVKLKPRSAVAVAESGIENAEHAALMRRAGYDAVLVGEALVKSSNPEKLLCSLRSVE